MKYKKASHVGIIISFVIFITFLAFIYATLDPVLKTKEDKKSTLKYLGLELQSELQANLTTVTIDLESTPTGCVFVQDLTIIPDLEAIRIYNSEGVILEHSSDAGINLKIDGTFTRIIKIYYSPEFIPAGGDPNLPCDPVGTIVSIKTGEKIFESKILDLINTRYVNDYELLKTELNLPGDSEFGLDFVYENNTRIGSGNVISSASIYVKEIPIEYLTSEANINFGKLIVKV